MPDQSFLGADIESLEALSRIFDRSGSALSTSAQTVDQARRRLVWTGSDADRFAANWDRSRALLERHARHLIEHGQLLVRQAGEQRTTSDGAATGGFFGGVLANAEQAAMALAQNIAWVNAQRATIEQLRNATPAEQLAYWNSLTPAQQEMLMTIAPGLLIGLHGLPSDVRDTAQQAWIERQKAEIITRTDDQYIKGEVDIKVVEISAEAHGIVTTYADGHAEVSLSLEADVMRKFGSDSANAGIGVHGKGSLVYTFANQHDAEEFLKGLKHELIPHGVEALFDPSGDVVDQVSDYLGKHSGEFSHFAIEAGVVGALSAKIGGSSIELKAGAGATYRSDSGERTVYIDVEGQGKGDLGIAKINGDVQARYELVMDKNNNVTGMRLTGQIDKAGGVDLVDVTTWLNGGKVPAPGSHALPVSVDVTAGSRVTFDVEIPLDTPARQHAALELLGSTLTGLPGNASDISTLMQSSTSTIGVFHTTHVAAGFDVNVAKLEVGQTVATADYTLVKGPDGQYIQVN